MCITPDRKLAVHAGTWLVERSDWSWYLSVTVKPGKRLEATLLKGKETDRKAEFLAAMWRCSESARLMDDPGDLYMIDSINDHNSLSALLKALP
ncbi:MAG: hypothetical protein ACFCUT_06795 [Kiloniellaceae bacterium]